MAFGESKAVLAWKGGNKMKITGVPVCFGCVDSFATLPISNLPPDTVKVRRRIRNDRVAVAFVKTRFSVQRWILGPDGNGALKLLFIQGENSSMPV